MVPYSIIHPDVGIEFLRLYYNQRKDSKQFVHQFENTKSEVKDVIDNLFPDCEYSVMLLGKNLEELRKHIDDFLKKLENQPFPSKKKPYLSEFLLDHNTGFLLYMICKLARPEKVVETGVAFGVSSSYILQALHDNNHGRLYSIDYSFRPWETRDMIGSIIPDNLRDRWNLIYGLSSKKLKPLLGRIGPIDIFYHDSDHTYRNMMFEFNSAWPAIRPAGLLISDDVGYNNSFYDFHTKEVRKPNIFSERPFRNTFLGIIQK